VNNVLNKVDQGFVRMLMVKYNIKSIEFAKSGSVSKWPDIWIENLDRKVPRITVTDEWKKQSTPERHKRLVHEIVCHYVKGMDHDERIGFSTYPKKDRYSQKLYKSLISNPSIEKHRESFTEALNETLTKVKKLIPGEAYGRIKSRESILEKIGRKKITLQDMTDIAGIRVVVNSMDDLHRAVKVVRNNFQVIQEEDYIKYPNKGYRSYHFIIMVKGKPIELQIRTMRMEDWANVTHDVFYKNRSKLVEKYRERLVNILEDYRDQMASYYHYKDIGIPIAKPEPPSIWKNIGLHSFLLNPK